MTQANYSEKALLKGPIQFTERAFTLEKLAVLFKAFDELEQSITHVLCYSKNALSPKQIMVNINTKPDLKRTTFYAIKNSLENLYSIGIVGRRGMKFKKTKELWFLTPGFMEAWIKAVKQIENNANENRMTDIESTLYFSLTGKTITNAKRKEQKIFHRD